MAQYPIQIRLFEDKETNEILKNIRELLKKDYYLNKIYEILKKKIIINKLNVVLKKINEIKIK